MRKTIIITNKKSALQCKAWKSKNTTSVGRHQPYSNQPMEGRKRENSGRQK